MNPLTDPRRRERSIAASRLAACGVKRSAAISRNVAYRNGGAFAPASSSSRREPRRARPGPRRARRRRRASPATARDWRASAAPPVSRACRRRRLRATHDRHGHRRLEQGQRRQLRLQLLGERHVAVHLLQRRPQRLDGLADRAGRTERQREGERRPRPLARARRCRECRPQGARPHRLACVERCCAEPNRASQAHERSGSSSARRRSRAATPGAPRSRAAVAASRSAPAAQAPAVPGSASTRCAATCSVAAPRVWSTVQRGRAARPAPAPAARTGSPRGRSDA